MVVPWDTFQSVLRSEGPLRIYESCHRRLRHQGENHLVYATRGVFRSDCVTDYNGRRIDLSLPSALSRVERYDRVSVATCSDQDGTSSAKELWPDGRNDDQSVTGNGKIYAESVAHPTNLDRDYVCCLRQQCADQELFTRHCEKDRVVQVGRNTRRLGAASFDRPTQLWLKLLFDKRPQVAIGVNKDELLGSHGKPIVNTIPDFLP